MRDAGAVAAKSLPEIKCKKMAEQTNDVLSFLNLFEKNLYFAWYSRSTVGQNFAKFVEQEGKQNLFLFGYRHLSIV